MKHTLKKILVLVIASGAAIASPAEADASVCRQIAEEIAQLQSIVELRCLPHVPQSKKLPAGECPPGNSEKFYKLNALKTTLAELKRTGQCN